MKRSTVWSLAAAIAGGIVLLRWLLTWWVMQ